MQRDAGRSYVPVPSNRGIPCPKATDKKSFQKRSAPSPTQAPYQHRVQNGEIVRHFENDSAFSFHTSYQRRRPSEENYKSYGEFADRHPSMHSMSALHDGSKKMKPTIMSTTGVASTSKDDDKHILAAAALLDLSHRPYSYSGGKNF